MSSGRRIQKKNSRKSTLPTSSDILQTRPFSNGKKAKESKLPTTNDILQTRPFPPRVEKAAPKEPPSLDQIETIQQFGYKGISLKTFAPSLEVESDTKEEAAAEIDELELELGDSSQPPPEVSPQENTIQRLCDDCKAEEKVDKEDKPVPENATPTETIQKNATPTETIQTKAETPNLGIVANFNQNRPLKINRQKTTLLTQTRQAKIPNQSNFNNFGANLFPLNKNHQIQRLTLRNQPYQGEVKSADLTQIMGTNPLLNKKKIQPQPEAKSQEKPQIGQGIQNLFASQLQRQPLPSPPSPSTTSTAKINPPPPGFLASNKHKKQPIQLKEETGKTGKETLIPKEITNFPPDDLKPVTPPQSLSINSTNPSIQRDILGIPTSIAEAKNKILSPVAQLATRIPGYSLLTVIIGKDPINGASVSRNGTNLIRGILSLVPGGDNIFNNLQQSGAIDKAFNWFNSQITKLNLTWETIKGLFKQAWDSLGMSDILSPSGALEKIKNVFTEPIGRIKNFAVAASTKVMEFVFEGVMGSGASKVMGIIKNAGGAFNNILKDPIAFCGNLVGAIRGGFQKFSGNIATHLKNGLTGWLFGALAGAGLTLPAQFDLKGIVSIVLQVVGATYNKLRGKLVNKVGEQKVGRLEKTFDFLKGIVTGGLVTAWQKIAEFTGNLQEMVMGGIKEWVKNSIITAAITKLISMFNPAGAIVQAVMAIYNTVMFFIERGAQIAALGEAVFSSIGSIAAGNVAGAANYVEQTMGRTLPVVISFLARLIGLGGISEEIKGLIKRVQGKVEDAISKVVEFIVEKGKSLLGKSGGDENNDENGKGKKGESASEKDHPKLAEQAVFELEKFDGRQKNYDTVRKETEAQAKVIEQKYTALLKPGIKLSVNFNDLEKDEQDGDIDFEVVIAPNTTRKRGSKEVGQDNSAKRVKVVTKVGLKGKDGKVIQEVEHAGTMEDVLLKVREAQIGSDEITLNQDTRNYAMADIQVSGVNKTGQQTTHRFPIPSNGVMQIFSSGTGKVKKEKVKLKIVDAVKGNTVRPAIVSQEIAELIPEIFVEATAKSESSQLQKTEIVVADEKELKEFISTKLAEAINRDKYVASLDKHSEQAVWQAFRTKQAEIAQMIDNLDLVEITQLSVHIHSEREMCPVCAAASNYMMSNIETEAPKIWHVLQKKKAQLQSETNVTSTVPFTGKAPRTLENNLPENSSTLPSKTNVLEPSGRTKAPEKLDSEHVKKLTQIESKIISRPGETE